MKGQDLSYCRTFRSGFSGYSIVEVTVSVSPDSSTAPSESSPRSRGTYVEGAVVGNNKEQDRSEGVMFEEEAPVFPLGGALLRCVFCPLSERDRELSVAAE